MTFALKKTALLGITIIPVILSSCSHIHDQSRVNPGTLFTLTDNKKDGIGFINQLKYTEEFNTYTYRNFYNGGGVALGDINNDGLIDIYFTGNLVDSKLYLNKGNFQFEDITDKAGVACHGVWCAGASMADINGDGLIDIFVCKSGYLEEKNRSNDLFINNGDLTFTNRAQEYGLADTGLSTQAAFFDYDKDGDLDMYLLNNSYRSVEGYDLTKNLRSIRDPNGGNKLYRNDGNHFTDVSAQAGIYGSAIGFGLGVTISDLNQDGWPDIYVSNDFFERDYLYINNKNGTFREVLEDQLRELSQGSMGEDIADINNDSRPDIFVTEMTPETEDRLKTKVLFDTWDQYEQKVKYGYYHQFERNVLQLNNGNDSFSEIGRLAGVSTTDWSWGALIMDLDHDGNKDIYVANGIYKDLLDQDYLNFYSNPAIVRNMINTQQHAILTMIHEIPSVSVPNYAFKNEGNLHFVNCATEWGMSIPSFSNGAAYGDLDNDGDLDMVVNNVNMPPFLFRNNASDLHLNHWITFELTGDKRNTEAIGSRVTVYCESDQYFQELMPARGFQSTVDNRLNFGLGGHDRVDSVRIEWPDDRITRTASLAANRFYKENINRSDSGEPRRKTTRVIPVFTEVTDQHILNYRHIENDFNDFTIQPLMWRMVSNEGPKVSVGDINGDHLDDIYIGGAKGQPGTLFVQIKNGSFSKPAEQVLAADRICEDAGSAIFDANNDGRNDLYVGSGGNEFSSSSTALLDRLYLNEGNGKFVKSAQLLPTTNFESTACVRCADYDGDGDQDLFVGIRLKPFAYGLPVNGYLLENDGKGNFRNVTAYHAPALIKIGMITDMQWVDIDRDGDLDMVLAGEYMPVSVLINNHGNFTDETAAWGLKNTRGWWHTLVTADLNNDGFPDLVAGNEGENTIFKATLEKPVTLCVNDFDLNGSVEQIICRYNGNKSYPYLMKDELVNQIPYLRTKYPDNKSFKDQTIQDIFTPEQLKRSIIDTINLTLTSVMINSGKGNFTVEAAPREAQYSPVYAIEIDDFNHDGIKDIVMGGNQYRVKPEVGINDASYGVFMEGTGDGTFNVLPYDKSGFFIKGEIRDFQSIRISNTRYLLVALNNSDVRLFKY